MSRLARRQRKQVCMLLSGLSVAVWVWPLAVMAQSPQCRVRITAVRFGNYDPASHTPVDTVGNVRIGCRRLGQGSQPVAYTIALSAGRSGSYQPRLMTQPQGQLQYNLYTDAARYQIWGDGSGRTAVVSDRYQLGNAPVTRDYPVYGRIPTSQDIRPGQYRDTLVVTVEF